MAAIRGCIYLWQGIPKFAYPISGIGRRGQGKGAIASPSRFSLSDILNYYSRQYGRQGRGLAPYHITPPPSKQYKLSWLLPIAMKVIALYRLALGVG